MALDRPLSHSSISMYEECPQKYKFKYVDRIPEKPKHFFSFGNSVHKALEYFYGGQAPAAPTASEAALPRAGTRSAAPSLEAVLDFYKRNWVRAGYKDSAQEAEYFEDGRSILGAFHRKHAPEFKLPMHVEYSFNMLVDGVPVTGKVDRVDALEDGRLAVLDYKTGKAIPAERVKDDAQLTMYQLACERLLGKPIGRLTFYHLPSLTELAIERHSDGLVDKLKRRVVDTANAIASRSFDPRPEEKKCYWCDYKPICPIFKPNAAGAAQPVAIVADKDAELGALVDRYGELKGDLARLQEELQELKSRILGLLEAKGYVRAFGKKYELVRTAEVKWGFSDKAAALRLIQDAGLYDKILAPSAPKVELLLSDPEVAAELKAALGALRAKTETVDAAVQPLLWG